MNVLASAQYALRQRPAAVLGRAANRAKKALLVRSPSAVLDPSLAPPEGGLVSAELRAFADEYRKAGFRYRDTEAMMRGDFTFRGYRHDFGAARDVRWGDVSAASPDREVWDHDLAFFNWAIPLVEEQRDAGMRSVAAYVQQLEAQALATPRGLNMFAWSPIACAIRSLALATVLGLGEEEPDTLYARQSIALHLLRCERLLARLDERYLGYNHAAFGAAARAAVAVALGNAHKSFVEQACRVLSRHTMADGFWEEMSPTYHCHMLHLAQSLVALIPDATTLSPDESALREALPLMASALRVVSHPDQAVAVFGDSSVEDAVPPSLLVGPEQLVCSPLETLDAAGYVRLSLGGLTVILDAGRFGPRDVVGHCHDDFLSIEASVGDRRFIVDPGVASLRQGAPRLWTRAGVTHNGPRVAGIEAVSTFGAWRAGKPGAAGLVSCAVGESVHATAWMDGFRSAAGIVTRSVELAPGGLATVVDRRERTGGVEMSTSYIVGADWHLVGTDTEAALFDFESDSGDRVRLGVDGADGVWLEPECYYPQGPLAPERGTRLSAATSGSELRTTFSRLARSGR